MSTFNDSDDEDLEDDDDVSSHHPISIPLVSPASKYGPGGRGGGGRIGGNTQFTILDMVVGMLRKSVLVTCSVEREDVVSSMDISCPTEVRHVAHVTFDRFNGFLGLPTELEPEVPRKVPSCSAKVFGVSAKSMQCSYDDRGNSVPSILLMMQRRLYVEGGLKAEGIFGINAENSQEEFLRDELNKGIVTRGIDVHCLAGLIKVREESSANARMLSILSTSPNCKNELCQFNSQIDESHKGSVDACTPVPTDRKCFKPAATVELESNIGSHSFDF